MVLYSCLCNEKEILCKCINLYWEKLENIFSYHEANVSYYQAQENVFGLISKLWKKRPVLCPHKVCSLRPNWAYSQQKSLNFLVFSQFTLVTISVPDLIGPMERCYWIATDRTPFWKIWFSKVTKSKLEL